MADFINTADVIGDDELCDKIIQKTVTEYKDDAVTNIGEYAFIGCTGLMNVECPEVTSIGQYAFRGCAGLTNAELNWSGITEIPIGVFMDCSSLVSVNAPEVVSIGGSVFERCGSLQHVSLPKLETINGGYNFRDCTSLTSISLPKLTSISEHAYGTFLNCASLKSVNLPLIDKLPQSTFAAHFGNGPIISMLDLPRCTKIGAGSMAMPTLEVLILRSQTVCTLDNINAFNNTLINAGTGYIYVPSALLANYQTATNWSTYAEQFRGIFEDEDVLQGIINENLVHLQSDKISIIPVRGCYNYLNIESVSSNSATEVKSQAFENCTALASVNLPNVNLIEGKAFRGCSSLRKVVFPSRISDLRDASFENCTSLEVVDFWDVNFTMSSAYHFHNCSSLKAYINRSTRYCEQSPHFYIFRNTPIRDESMLGYVYVPRRMINTYVSKKWGGVSESKYRALEDYTIDGTITGELREHTERLSLDMSELTFTNANRQQLTLTGEFGIFDNISWATSDYSVVTINHGVVTPISDGTAIVTVTSGNHSTECTVIVNAGLELSNILDGLTFNIGYLGSDGSIANTTSTSDTYTNKFNISNYANTPIDIELLDVYAAAGHSRICYYDANENYISSVSGYAADYGAIIRSTVPTNAVYAAISVNKSVGFSEINILCSNVTIGHVVYTS